MLVYVICYGAAMLFCIQRPFYLIRNVTDVCSTISLSVGIWEKRQSASSPRTVFLVLCGRRRNLLPEAVKPSEGLEFRDLGVLFVAFAAFWNVYALAEKEIWIWERKKKRL